MKEPGIRIGQFYFNLSSTGVVISNSRENYHITLCYNEFIKAFDLHKKLNGQKECVYRKTIDEKVVWDFISILTPKLIKIGFKLLLSLRKVKIKTLEKEKYQIVVHGDESIQDVLFENCRKKRGNIILEPDLIRNNYIEQYGYIYPPNVISDTDFPDTALMHAFRIDESGKEKEILLIKNGNNIFTVKDSFFDALKSINIEFSDKAIKEFEEICENLEIHKIGEAISEFIDQLMIDNQQKLIE